MRKIITYKDRKVLIDGTIKAKGIEQNSNNPRQDHAKPQHKITIIKY